MNPATINTKFVFMLSLWQLNYCWELSLTKKSHQKLFQLSNFMYVIQ